MLGGDPRRAADVVPTENYAIFALARRFGMTVRQLLSGHCEPLTAMEYYLWNRYYAATARLEKQSGRRK